MPVALRDSSALRTIAAIKMRDAGNVLRTVQIGMMRDAGDTLRTVWSPMSAAIAPPSWAGTSGTFTFPKTITTGNVTANPTGGVAPFSYAWARISGDAAIVANSPAVKTTIFSATFASENSYSAVFEVTVTDANGAKAKAQCEITLTVVDYN